MSPWWDRSSPMRTWSMLCPGQRIPVNGYRSLLSCALRCAFNVSDLPPEGQRDGHVHLLSPGHGSTEITR
ncbi:hypothetical protein FKM82_021682 [Ascaphus truei]